MQFNKFLKLMNFNNNFKKLIQMKKILKMELEGQYQHFLQNLCSKNLTVQLCKFILVRNLQAVQIVVRHCHQPKIEKFLRSQTFQYCPIK